MKSEQYVEQAIVQLLTLKLRAGTPTADLDAFVRKCLSQALRAFKVKQSYRGLGIHRLGSVLRAWYKETPYLTFDGLPRPLRVEGRSSLKTLIRRFFPAEKFDVVFTCLLESRLIRRHSADHWVPSGRTARISQLSQETLEHLSEGVARYVETVTRNVTATREQDVLFEQSCKVTTLPAPEFEAFREYVGKQAIAFLTSVDDWLETRSAKQVRKGNRKCTAGVHTFAFLAPNPRGRPRLK